ncbi:MAG: ABC transporter ATP-binding protein [Azospirillum sp.]|jgi:lipoprotein-releasing system ATP-binding protein|nr:ABC transporter ATP-binding protein [Azospirillum sp.]MCZ8124642.1 ABC transporter ATP-binding protein [Magnetospirillum sp.]
MSEPALELKGLHRRFRQAGGELHVLRGLDLRLMPGECVALVGPSGAGKSTLLHCAGLLERPDAGQVLLGGRDCAAMDEGARTEARLADLGFVYQFHHLLPEFTALENVTMPQLIAGKPRDEAAARARELLGRVGLSARADHRPARLSGGEQQRVAIVRAVANAPKVLLADEPTGNLDPRTAEGVFAELLTLVRTTGLAALVATHNPELAARMDRTVVLRDGVLAAP